MKFPTKLIAIIFGLGGAGGLIAYFLKPTATTTYSSNDSKVKKEFYKKKKLDTDFDKNFEGVFSLQNEKKLP